MRILIDLTQIPIQKVGVGIYAVNLISEISGIDKANFYFLLLQDDDNELLFPQLHNISFIKIKSRYFRRLIPRFFLEQFYIPYLIIRHKIRVVHSLHYSFPLFAIAKKVVTIHDLTFFKFPEGHVFIKRHYFKLFIMLASIFADRIIVDSESTLNDLAGLFSYARNKTIVIYLGKNDFFKPDLENSKIEAVKNKYKTGSDYILFIGTLEPRKNIKNLILAFHKFSKEDCSYKLVIAGKRGWRYQETMILPKQLNLEKNVIFTGYISEEDKPFLIAGSKIFIYPSIYEGFGIPVLEALACGVPTITSNLSSLPEVAGDAALLIEPSSAEELYSSIKKLLEDKALYTQLNQRGIKQAKKFSWKKTALQTLSLYNSFS